MTTNRHFDLIAPWYERLFPPPDPRRLVEVLGLPARGWFLDAAGGTGRVANTLCGLVERLVISDLSLPMLRQVNRAGCARTCQARVERLPYPSDRFSRILVVDAFHHFADQPGSLRELARVLEPGGRLVIQEPDIQHPAVKLVALVERLLGMGSHFEPAEGICALLAQAGLRATAIREEASLWAIGEKS